jgi:LAO/AO transport system kinase
MYGFEIYEGARKPVAVERIVTSLRAGDESMLARTISLIERRAPERIALLKALFPFAGDARTVGITGAPGSGKSTLAGQVIRAYRQQGDTVAVIAVDPTSPYSGGATLGDRIRMQESAGDPGVFIRSMASRGQLGGLAPATADVATIFDASGWDRILIETVGVGQDQLDILSLADALIVLMVPGMSDDLQVAKAGIVEAADIFVINKSDHNGVEQIERALREGLSLNHRPDGWRPPIIQTVATTGTGVPDLISAVDAYFRFLQQHNLLHRKQVEKWQVRLVQMVREHLIERLLNPDFGALFRFYAAAVAERKTDPYTAVEHLLGSATEQHVIRRPLRGD